MQSRYLIWFSRDELTRKISIKKPLIIPQKKFNTFIVFELSRSPSSRDVKITLSKESKNLLTSKNLKCKCVFYDSVKCSSSQGISQETVETSYFGSLLEITVLNGNNCGEFSDINFEEDYIYDRSPKRASRVMTDQIYFQIPMQPSTQLTFFEKRLTDEYVFKFKSSLISVLYGKYKLPLDFYNFLEESKMAAFVSMLKQTQYTYKHFDERFELAYGSNSKSMTRFDGYLLAVHIRKIGTGDLEEEKQKAMEYLFENEINYKEAATSGHKESFQKTMQVWDFDDLEEIQMVKSFSVARNCSSV